MRQLLRKLRAFGAALIVSLSLAAPVFGQSPLDEAKTLNAQVGVPVATENAASIVIDSRHDNTRRENQCAGEIGPNTATLVEVIIAV